MIEAVGVVMGYIVFFGLLIFPLCAIGIGHGIAIVYAIGD